MQAEQTTPEKEAMHRRICELFMAYRGHIFQPFEKVLIYFRDRESQDRFTKTEARKMPSLQGGIGIASC